ncbi:Glucosaminyl phosphatidylinositol (GlcN-PI) nositol acylation protein [Malassezia yamatoensis]|uniref:GPI-anchored wall transfer protein n=1 Tax=Malassezia yamatoensis TaxID=253288 RepID=A0AAJ5YWW6_9BASI|nr:Glucosaminyl phosphatidylinositol (GlcN-PI) nositol acylation protein [Malassezia yamatoensis]
MASRFVPRMLSQTRGYASQSAAIRPPKQINTLSGRYASAVYVAALQKGEKTLDKVMNDLKGFHDTLASSSQDSVKLRTFLTNPTISASNKDQVFSALTTKGGADEITRNLFDTLSDNNRLNLTEKVITDFMELISAHQGEVTIQVTSAKPLDKSATSRLESALKQSQFASSSDVKKVKFAYSVNPQIQGGLEVHFGDRTVDLSVSSRVNKLNTLLRVDLGYYAIFALAFCGFWTNEMYVLSAAYLLASKYYQSFLLPQRFQPKSPPGMPPDWHTYKLAKEAFVAGHTGSSVLEINRVCATALVSYAVWISLQRYAFVQRYYVIIDWLVLVAPLGLACTVLATDIYKLLACMLLIICVLECDELRAKKLQKQPAAVQQSVSYDKRCEELTIYRTYLMILTVLCILAVDFPVFPRAYAKCESWGTSLMDLGVGSFVFSHATVSRRKQAAGNVYRILRRTLPLLVLGLARVVMVKGTEYPEHVSEYGVHWNFFLTLGIVIPVLDGIQVALSGPYMIWGVLLAVVHETFLCTTELSAWAIAELRDAHSLVSLNKEGIVSLPGRRCG